MNGLELNEVPESLRRTPLFGQYESLGAKTVPFGGWEMPVQFIGIVDEHMAVRQRAGLFDVSHMGEIEVIGANALDTIQMVVTNDVSRLKPGQALYSPMSDDTGGTMDDVLVYRFSADRFWVVVNAANIQKDYDWILAHSSGHCEVVDRSSDIALLAIQGPSAAPVLQRSTYEDLSEIRPFRFREMQISNCSVVVSRTGYTGEDGFELYCASADATRLWRTLLASGQPDGLVPCGLGCRDTLRLEAGLPLYGHELSPDISPLEAGLNRFVKLDKGDFVGRPALSEQAQAGPPRQIVGLQSLERGIPRDGYQVLEGETAIGVITSGTMSPTLKTPIAMALVNRHHVQLGKVVEVDVRGRRVPCEQVALPFYRRPRVNG